MKKLIFLFLLLFVFNAEAQQSVIYKMKYLPNRDYDGQVSMNINCNIALAGDTQITNKLKSQGITQPVAFDMNMKMTGDIKTGSPPQTVYIRLI